MPSVLHRFSVRCVSASVSSANGTDRGSAVMMMSGWTKLSNCATSTM